MSELAQNLDVREDKPESAIITAERASTPEQTTENVKIVPISQVLKLTAPDGKGDEVICYGEVEDLGKGVTMSKAKIIPMEIAGLMDPDEPEAKQGGTKRAIAATIAAILGGGAVVSTINGCGANNGSDTAISQMNKKMTSADYDHNFQDQGVACFSQPGDGPLSIGTLPNGDKILVFTRDSGGGIYHCYGVTAPDYQTAVTQECTPQDIALEGIVFPGGNPTITSCTADGTRMAAARGLESLYYDLDVTGGVITASNPQGNGALLSGAGQMNFIRDGGQQYLLTDNGSGQTVRKINLDTQTYDPTTVPYDYGLFHKDDAAGIWTRARESGGDIIVIKSTTEAGLASSIVQIPGIPQDSTDPRAGDTMFFFNAADGNHYAIVLPYCGDGTCNNGETNATCPGDCPATPVCGDGTQDATEVCDDGNTTDGDGCSADCMSDETCGNGITDTAVGEVCDDSNTTSGDGCSADCQSDESCDNGTCDTAAGEDYNNCPQDCTGECGDDVCDPTENNATCAADCDPEYVCGDNTCEGTEDHASCPEDCASDPACQPFIDDSRIKFVQGAENCELENCVDLPTEEYLTVRGECRFQLDLGGANPVEVSIAPTNGSTDGAYKIDFIEQLGELLSGQYDITDNGNHFGTTYRKNGHTVFTGVEGTTYGGEEMTIPENSHDGYKVEVSEGTINVYKDDVLLVTLDQSGSVIVDMEENGTEPDAGVDGGVDGGADGGVDGGADAGTTPPEEPGCKKGCNASKGELPSTELAFIGLMLLALGRRMRRKRMESVARNSERIPGPLLMGFVKEKVGELVARFRK